MPLPPPLPANFVVADAPPDLVESFVVQAGFLRGDVSQSLGSAVFPAAGGQLRAGIPPNDALAFPTTVDVLVTVNYTSSSGLPGFTVSATVPVTAAGVQYVYTLPRRTPQVIEFGLGSLGPPTFSGEKLRVDWTHLVGGVVVRSGEFTAVTPQGRGSLDPATVGVALYLYPQLPSPAPSQPNTLRVQATATLGNGQLGGRQTLPLDQTYPADTPPLRGVTFALQDAGVPAGTKHQLTATVS